MRCRSSPYPSFLACERPLHSGTCVWGRRISSLNTVISSSCFSSYLVEVEIAIEGVAPRRLKVLRRSATFFSLTPLLPLPSFFSSLSGIRLSLSGLSSTYGPYLSLVVVGLLKALWVAEETNA